MAQQKNKTITVVTHRPPSIDVYYITDDELSRIEEKVGQVGQDLAFMLTSLSVCIAFFIALMTGTFEPATELTFKAAVGVSGISALYTGLRWFRHRKTAPDIINKIRDREVDPDA